MALTGTKYTVRQQLFTIYQNFEVFDASGAKVMSAHGNGLRVMDKLELRDATDKTILVVRQKPGVRPKIDIVSNGKKLMSMGERRVGLRDHFVIDSPLPATFDITGNMWSTNYLITINGEAAAQVYMEPGLVKADTYHVIIGKGRSPRILFGMILGTDILTHQGKR